MTVVLRPTGGWYSECASCVVAALGDTIAGVV
jgi:hypothetical protein